MRPAPATLALSIDNAGHGMGERRQKPNREHFHVWAMAAPPNGNAMMYRIARGFGSRQAARQYAARWYPDHETAVQQCRHGDDCPHKPVLD